MRNRRLSAVILSGILLTTAACGSQDTTSDRSGEDQGLVPDTSPTEPNAITPSDDAATGAATPAQ